MAVGTGLCETGIGCVAGVPVAAMELIILIPAGE